MCIIRQSDHHFSPAFRYSPLPGPFYIIFVIYFIYTTSVIFIFMFLCHFDLASPIGDAKRLVSRRVRAADRPAGVPYDSRSLPTPCFRRPTTTTRRIAIRPVLVIAHLLSHLQPNSCHDDVLVYQSSPTLPQSSAQRAPPIPSTCTNQVTARYVVLNQFVLRTLNFYVPYDIRRNRVNNY